MHVLIADKADKDGSHILTATIEGDGPVALASEKSELKANIISVLRTASGGVEVKVGLSISAPSLVPELSPEEKALAYLSANGLSPEEAKDALDKFGLVRIQARIAEAEAYKQAQLDKELAAKLEK